MTGRSTLTIAYVAATVLGGVGALVMVVMEATAPDASRLDLLVWSALALLLFVSAGYRWWRGGQGRSARGGSWRPSGRSRWSLPSRAPTARSTPSAASAARTPA